jgi:glycosyltransferase involved in cell wall biosynthesis
MRKQILILGHNDATQFIDIYNQYTRIFDKNKYEVTVAYLTGDYNEASNARTIAEHVLFLQASKKSVRGLKIKITQQLLALCREKKFDIVISHRYKPSYVMLWVNQFYKIPALFCVMHEIGTMSGFNRPLLMRCLARKNTYFAGVSNAVRDDLRKSLWGIDHQQIITLYNTIDMELVEPTLLSRDTARAKLNLSSDDFIFGHIGRLVPNKDQDTLIKAFAKIIPHCPNAKLIIMGEGELELSIKSLIQTLKLENHVILTGFITQASQYMKAFDCFVLSSIQEAFGRVLIEAMVAKLPIIATRVHGIPEVMGDTGILINAKNAEQLAEAMQTIYQLTIKEREQIGAIAYQHVTDNYSIPAFETQFWNLGLTKTLKD